MMLSRAVALLSLTTLVLAQKDTKDTKERVVTTAKKETKQICDRRKYDGDFKACVRKGTAQAECMTTMKAAMEKDAACKSMMPDKADEKMLAKEEARKKLEACITGGTARDTCMAAFQKTTGSDVKDKTAKENMMKREAEKGMADSVAEKLKACKKDKKCAEGVMKIVEKLKGRNITKEEFAHDKRKAGQTKAGETIRACVAAAADEAAKKACLSSAEAKKAAAEASGKDEKDITVEDLKKGARDQGMKKVKELIDACMADADTDDKKKACRKKADFKRMIADSEGKMTKNITDSKVREYMKKAAKDEALLTASTCNKTDKTAMDKCKEERKAAFAKAMGKGASDVSDDEVRREMKSAMAQGVGERMVACMEDAKKDANGDAKKLEEGMAKCKAMAKKFVKESDLENAGKNVTAAKLKSIMKRAGKDKSKDVMKDCQKTREECMTLVRERVAAAMGKKEVKKVDAEVMNRDGAFTAAREAAAACAKAKKDNSSATCDDFVGKFLDVRKLSKEKDPKKAKQRESEVKRGAVVDMDKSVGKTCMEKKTKEEVQKCFDGFKKDREETAGELFKGMSEEDKKKRMETTKREALQELIGEDFKDCMEAAAEASNDTAKKACMVELKGKTDLSGLKDKAEAVLKRARGADVAKAAAACESKDRKSCLDDMKKKAVATGMKEKNWADVKRKGSNEEAAKAFAACKQDATISDEDCLDRAKKSFQKVSGNTNEEAWKALKDKVKKLGDAKKDGVEVKLKYKKQVDIDVVSDATACSKGLEKAFIEAIKDTIKVKLNMGKMLKGTKAKVPACSVVDGKAQLSVMVGAKDLTEEEIETASDEIAAKLKAKKMSWTTTTTTTVAARRLSEHNLRRLAGSVSVSDAYATQGSELCADTDSTCGQTEVTETDDGTSSPAPGPAPAPGGAISGETSDSTAPVVSGALFAVSALLALSNLS